MPSEMMRCGATNRDGYDCELPAHHDGDHRSLIGASDEQGCVPEVRWHETPIHHEFSATGCDCPSCEMPSAKPAASPAGSATQTPDALLQAAHAAASDIEFYLSGGIVSEDTWREHVDDLRRAALLHSPKGRE